MTRRQDAAVPRRRPRQLLGIALIYGFALICLVTMVVVLALTRLALEHIQQVLDQIGYCGLLIGSGCYLMFAGRRPAPTERKQAFRKPARIMALGLFLLAAAALMLLTLTGPDSTPATWIQVLLPTLFAGGIVFIWQGNRGYSRAEKAHPGKHAHPSNGPRSR